MHLSSTVVHTFMLYFDVLRGFCLHLEEVEGFLVQAFLYVYNSDGSLFRSFPYCKLASRF